MIQKATGSVPLERMENKRVYNLVENLCISCGMKMPIINLIEDDSLNAFASGINTSSFTISLSRGIIDKLNDEELEAVIAHEVTHIRNRDVRLLIVSIIFVGIFSFVTEALFRAVRFGSGGKGKKDGRIILIALLLAAIGYLLSSIFRFALSKKRCRFRRDDKKPVGTGFCIGKNFPGFTNRSRKPDGRCTAFYRQPESEGEKQQFILLLFYFCHTSSNSKENRTT
jgi:hypothetical protein